MHRKLNFNKKLLLIYSPSDISTYIISWFFGGRCKILSPFEYTEALVLRSNIGAKILCSKLNFSARLYYLFI